MPVLVLFISSSLHPGHPSLQSFLSLAAASNGAAAAAEDSFLSPAAIISVLSDEREMGCGDQLGRRLLPRSEAEKRKAPVHLCGSKWSSKAHKVALA